MTRTELITRTSTEWREAIQAHYQSIENDNSAEISATRETLFKIHFFAQMLIDDLAKFTTIHDQR